MSHLQTAGFAGPLDATTATTAAAPATDGPAAATPALASARAGCPGRTGLAWGGLAVSTLRGVLALDIAILTVLAHEKAASAHLHAVEGRDSVSSLRVSHTHRHIAHSV